MNEHDPLERLARTIDEPVPPDPAFADGLKSHLLRSLAEPEGAESAALRRSPQPVSVPGMGSRRHERVRRTSTWLQIAAVLMLAVGVTAATISLRHNEPTPSVIPAIQGQATGHSDASSEVKPVWRVFPNGEPNLVTRPVLSLENSLAVMGERLFRLVWTSRFEGVIAYDASTGDVIWEQEFKHQGSGLVKAGDDLVFVMSKPAVGATITAFDQQTGMELWSTTTSTEAYDLAFADERIFIWDGQAELVELDTSSGEKVASRRFTHASRSGPEVYFTPGGGQLIVAGDVLIVGTVGGLLVAVPVSNFDTAQFLWRQEVGNGAMALTSTDGVIATLTHRYVSDYVNGSPTLFYSVAAFDLITGELLWETPDESSTAGPPWAIPGGFAFGLWKRDSGSPTSVSDPFVLQGRDARTGNVLWTIDGILPGASSLDAKRLLALRIDLDPPQARMVSTVDGTLSTGFVTAASLDTLFFVIDNERFYTVDDDYALVAYELSAFFDD